jgi:hypothetical protein
MPGCVEKSGRYSQARVESDGPGLLVSAAFWCGGALSLAMWVTLAVALGVF